MEPILPTIKGRGAASNPPNRFERIHVEDDFEHFEGDTEFLDSLKKVPTQYFIDSSRSVIARNNSPDIPFELSLNPYRGCSHGCSYCYARPSHEWLGFSPGLDFETKVMVKMDAPELLRRELTAKNWQPKTISIGGVTDPYQPVERRLQITRRCLEVFAEFRNPIGLVTKNRLVARDIDIWSRLAKDDLALVFISVTTLDPDLTRVMEPRTSTPANRLRAVRELAAAGVPVGVMVAPVIPGLTDHEMPMILQAAADVGARAAGFVPLRLPYAVKDIFTDWLARHFPDRKEKVLNRVRSMRGGKLNDPNFQSRMSGDGPFAEQIRQMFEIGCRKAGIPNDLPKLRKDLFRRPAADGGPQMTLFGA